MPSREGDIGCAETVVLLLLCPWLLLLRGWCLWLMWGWFVAPLGFPLSGVGHAVGIGALAASFMRTDLRPSEKSTGERIATSLAWMGLTLLIAWVASWWMP